LQQPSFSGVCAVTRYSLSGLLLLCVSGALAQSDVYERASLDELEQRARTQREREQSPKTSLAQQRVHVAEAELRERLAEIAIGKQTLDIGMDALSRLYHARLALPPEEFDPLLAADALVFAIQQLTDSVELAYRQGREKLANLAQVHESLAWARLQQQEARKRSRTAPGGTRLDGGLDSSIAVDDAERLARTREQGERFTREDLLRQRYFAAQTWRMAREAEVAIGKETLDILLEASLKEMEAGIALTNDPTDQLAHRELAWWRAFHAARTTQSRYDVGREKIANLAESVTARLWFQIEWLRALQSLKGASSTALVCAHVASSYWVDYRTNTPWDDLGVLAHAKRKATAADLRELMKERVLSSQLSWYARFAEVEIGRETLDILEDALRKAAEARLALAETSQERLTILREVLELVWRAERTVVSKYSVGRERLANLMFARYHRLTVELQIEEELAKNRP